MEQVDRRLTWIYLTDLVFTVARDVVRNCQTPVPILADYAAAAADAALAAPSSTAISP